MMSLRRIVIPLDGSERAEAVLPFVGVLTEHVTADVLLLEAINPQLLSAHRPEGSLSPETTQRIIEAEMNVARDYLEGVATYIRARSPGQQVRTEVTFAPVASAIIDAANAEPNDSMVAMTTHGRTGLARFAMGSVASLVVRGVEAPVLLVRPLTKVPERLDSILVPLDGSPLAETVLAPVASLAPAFQARVVLLMAAAAEYAAAGAYLETAADVLRRHGVSEVTCEIVPDPPCDAILTTANQQDITLIAMATHGRTGLRRWVFGSVADHVLHNATQPTLLVRARV